MDSAFYPVSWQVPSADFGAAEVEALLTHLGVQGKVVASTQNQALSALLFLYREVFAVDLAWLDGPDPRCALPRPSPQAGEGTVRAGFVQLVLNDRSHAPAWEYTRWRSSAGGRFTRAFEQPQPFFQSTLMRWAFSASRLESDARRIKA